MFRRIIFILISALILTACGGAAATSAPAATEVPATEVPVATEAPVEPLIPELSPTLDPTQTFTPEPTFTPSLTPTETQLPPLELPTEAVNAPVVGYTWNGPSGYFRNQQNDSTGLYLPGNYTVTVTSFTSGCSRTATVNVKLDTIKPNVTLPAGPYIIPCNPASLLLNGTSTTTPTSLQWYNQAAASTLYTNPHTVTAPGNYVLLVQNLYNGCKNRDTLTAILNNAVPSVTVTSYPSYTNIAVPADTLTCFQPTLSINAVFSPTNCTIQWKEVATNSLFPNPITVSTQGYYIPVVTRLDNNCTDASKIIFITQDKLPPNLSLSSASSNINCSYATATLSAVSSRSYDKHACQRCSQLLKLLNVPLRVRLWV